MDSPNKGPAFQGHGWWMTSSYSDIASAVVVRFGECTDLSMIKQILIESDALSCASSRCNAIRTLETTRAWLLRWPRHVIKTTSGATRYLTVGTMTTFGFIYGYRLGELTTHRQYNCGTKAVCCTIGFTISTKPPSQCRRELIDVMWRTLCYKSRKS